MHTIRRSALVEHSATRMFDLVNDVAAYPRRFDWCSAADLIERSEERLVARLDLGLGSLRTWFTTENALDRPHRIDMNLVDGPFRKLHGRWDFHALDESACKVTLTLEFEPSSRLLAPAMALGFQGLADRMVDDFVRAADRGNDMRVEVIRAWPHRFESVVLELPEGATVSDARIASGLADAEHAAASIHGVNASEDAVLNEGDRVELLRPLLLDPKEARRRRALR